MSDSLPANSPFAEYLIRITGELWGRASSNWDRPKHEQHAELMRQFFSLLETEYGADTVTRYTADLLAYMNHPEHVEWWREKRKWELAEQQQRLSFACWLWQAHHPSDYARDLFIKQLNWENENPDSTPYHSIYKALYLVADVIESWIGKEYFYRTNFMSGPLHPQPIPQGQALIIHILENDLLPWGFTAKNKLYSLYLHALWETPAYDRELYKKVLSTHHEVCSHSGRLEMGHITEETLEVIYELTEEINDDNAALCIYGPNPADGRWVIRACEHIEKLGLKSLASKNSFEFSVIHALRKCCRVWGLHESETKLDLCRELERFSPATRRIAAGTARPTARECLLAHPDAALPTAFEPFKNLFLESSKSTIQRFANSPDPSEGVLPIHELRKLITEMGDSGIKQLYEEFGQLGTDSAHEVTMLNALLGKDRKKTETAMKRFGQIAIKAYGVYPLPDTEPARMDEVKDRYLHIQELIQEADKFKKDRRSNTLAATQVALTNLAINAGYASRMSFELEMLMAGNTASEQLPCIEHETFTAAVILTPSGPAIEATNNGRPLKSPPPALKKTDAFKALKEQEVIHTQQFKHIQSILEDCMLTSRTLTPAEIYKLNSLPSAHYLLQSLLLIDKEGTAGFLSADCTRLTSTTEEHSLTQALHIAHPVNLTDKQIGHWKNELEALGRQQAIPQLHRPTHTIQPEEKSLTEKSITGRRAQARKFFNHLTELGWTCTQVDYPFIYKNYRTHGLRATIMPPNDVHHFASEDTIEMDHLRFSDIEEQYYIHFDPVTLAEVPAVIFSEAMKNITEAYELHKV